MISLALQYHPSRAHLLHRTAHLDIEVVADPEPDSHPSPWRTYRHCLETMPADCSHRVVLQDDAEVCDDFELVLGQALRARPDDLVVLFVPTTHRVGSRAVLEACGRDRGWAELPVTGNFWLPVVGVAWPRQLALGFLAWADEVGFADIPRHRSDDAIAGRFCVGNQVRPWATVGSLVEHPDVDESLIENSHSIKRRAACFAGRSALQIDWAT